MAKLVDAQHLKCCDPKGRAGSSPAWSTMTDLKPIHKFNNGRGATLCHTCHVIICTGLTDDLYCESHKPTASLVELVDTQLLGSCPVIGCKFESYMRHTK